HCTRFEPEMVGTWAIRQNIDAPRIGCAAHLGTQRNRPRKQALCRLGSAAAQGAEMARDRMLRVGALNIKTMPESADTYAALLRRAHGTRLAVRFRGNRFGMVGSLTEEEFKKGEHNEQVQFGSLDLFTEIALNEPWFDLRLRQQAEEKEVQEVKVPPHLRPEH